MQTQSDVIQVQVVRPSCVETTALGAAYLAGLAVGYWESKDEIRGNMSIDRYFKPEISAEQSRKMTEGWKKAVSYAFNQAKE